MSNQQRLAVRQKESCPVSQSHNFFAQRTGREWAGINAKFSGEQSNTFFPYLQEDLQVLHIFLFCFNQILKGVLRSWKGEHRLFKRRALELFQVRGIKKYGRFWLVRGRGRTDVEHGKINRNQGQEQQVGAYMRRDGSQWLLVTESWVGWSRIEGLGDAWEGKKRFQW